MKVDLIEIADADIPAVAGFLHTNLNQKVSADVWAAALIPPWSVKAPNHGYLLRRGPEVVGAYVAFYSQRTIGEQVEKFCNLAAWCVAPEYRLHSLRLYRALIGQSGYTFTDLSPSGNVIELNAKSGFEFLDTKTALLPNLPWPTIPGRVRITDDLERIDATLGGPTLQVFRDHRTAPAAHHLLVELGSAKCYVIFRRDRRKDLPLFGSLLYASDPELLRRAVRPVTRHLLIRHGLPATLVDVRLMARPPRWALRLNSARPKMYKSPSLASDQIDNLYSELVCVPW